MAKRIPEETLERIREAADILEVVSEHVQLKQRGRNYFGLCPFHTEKTPSFSVNPDLQIYRCFGCGAGGNVFRFVQEIDRVSFVEAVSFLAQRTGIALPADQKRGDDDQSDYLYRANELASKYFGHMLRQPQGQKALEYLYSRGLDDATFERFGLGYAPPGWTSFMEVAGRRGFDPPVLERAGLALASRRGSGHYDRFRDRVTFQIANLSGRAIGFGARALQPDDEPKYLNSPETEIYHKSAVLYGMSETRQAIRQRDCAIVVEGYMDLLSLVQRGVEAVVATSGTALTEQHTRLLGRYAQRVVLVFDGDTAGSMAAGRGIETLLGTNLDIRVVSLPPEHDPDSYVRQNGPDEFERLVEHAGSGLDFYLDQLARRMDLGSVGGKAQAAGLLMPLFERCRESVRRDLMLRQAAQRLDVDEIALREDLQRAMERPRRPGRTVAAAPVDERLPDPPRPEREFLGLLLQHPGFIAASASQLDLEALSDPRVIELLRLLFERYAGDAGDGYRTLDIAMLMSDLESPALVQLVSICAMEGFDETQVERQWADYIYSFRRDNLTRQIEAVRRQQLTAVSAGDTDGATRAATEMAGLIQSRRELEEGHAS